MPFRNLKHICSMFAKPGLSLKLILMVGLTAQRHEVAVKKKKKKVHLNSVFSVPILIDAINNGVRLHYHTGESHRVHVRCIKSSSFNRLAYEV